jgi:hypothetical protein
MDLREKWEKVLPLRHEGRKGHKGRYEKFE